MTTPIFRLFKCYHRKKEFNIPDIGIYYFIGIYFIKPYYFHLKIDKQ